MENEYIKMLKELQSKYKVEVSNIDLMFGEGEITPLIVRRATIKAQVLPTIEFLIKELQDKK